MSFQMEAKMFGSKEVEDALKQLPKSISKSVARRVLKKAAKPVLEGAKQKAPVGPTGNLKESLIISTKVTPSQKKFLESGKGVVVHVGASHPKGAHAHFLEFGTRKMPPQPFLRPAWDSNKDKSLKIIGEEMGPFIEKAAATLRKKAEKGTLGKRTIKQLQNR